MNWSRDKLSIHLLPSSGVRRHRVRARCRGRPPLLPGGRGGGVHQRHHPQQPGRTPPRPPRGLGHAPQYGWTGRIKQLFPW